MSTSLPPLQNKKINQNRESKPEHYLREIRDLQKQNIQILETLKQYEEKKRSQQKWIIIIKGIGILLPYILSILLVWSFYNNINTSLHSITSSVDTIPEKIKGSFPDQWEKVSNTGKEIWEGSAEKRENTKNTIKEKWENFNN